MRQLTDEEQEVMDYLATTTHAFMASRAIGEALRPKQKSASAWASPICLRLEDLGLLQRRGHGKYRLTDVQDGRRADLKLRHQARRHGGKTD